VRIAVTGATGRLGRQVVEHLGRAEVVGMSRANADYDDPQALRHAMRGADKLVFISSDGEAAKVLLHHQNVLAAAVDAKVKQIVLLSGADADVDSPFCYAHTNGVTESLLIESGLDYSIARAGLFQEFFLGLFHRTGGRLPMGDGRVSLISRDEVAKSLAALALAPPSGAHHLLTGPESLSIKDLNGTDISPAEFIAELARAGEEPWWIYAYATMFESIRDGRWAKVSTAFPSTSFTPA
jgi:NAD(P)H dehydrogenase (quinone)